MTVGRDYYFNKSALCGSQSLAFWDDDISDFGQCFQSLILICPTHIMLACLSAYYVGVRSSPYFIRTRVQKWCLYVRTASTLVLSLLPLMVTVLLNATRTEIWEDQGYSEIIETVVTTMAWVIHAVYTGLLFERIDPSPRGPRAMLFIWSLCAITDIIQCRSILLLTSPDSLENKTLYAFAITTMICLCLYLCSLLPGGDTIESQCEELITNETNEEREPLIHRRSHTYGGFHEDVDPNYLGVAREDSSPLNRLCFYWVNQLIRKGRRHLLQSPDDLYDLPHGMSAPVASEIFQGTKDRVQSEGANDEQIHLIRILFRIFSKPFFSIGFLKFVADCVGFACPILLNLLVKFMEDAKEDIRWGYLYAFLLVTATIIVALCNTHFNMLMGELTLKIRASVITAVYRHTLGISSATLNRFSMGEVINHMSTDCDRIVNFCPSFHSAWSIPFQIAVTLGLLYQQVGVSFLVGVFIMVFMIPLDKVIADKIGSLSTKMMAAKDERVKTMSEILFGVRVIKLFTWEQHFKNKVNDVRTTELKQLKGRKYLDAICVYLWATTPVLISVSTFVTCSLLGNQLTAAKVFTAVALFNMLNGPLNSFPWVINGLVEALVSIKRIRRFLSLPVINREAYFDGIDDVADVEDRDNTDVAICNAKFKHKSEETVFEMQDVNVTVKTGEFVGIIGMVGSGKSSLLASILGEMEKSAGLIAVQNPLTGIGYVQQEPWLQQGTVRDNILFGRVYQHHWYNKVIEACALKGDFQQLSSGDMTNVGEAGAMLSGGQKARVALARAVYQDKDIYLIDDIFSAVDKPVAQHILKRCILGLLKDKTRILCTHHTQFLVNANQVLLLEDGVITDQGPAHRVLPKVDISENDEKDHDEGEESDDVQTNEVCELISEESREEGKVKLGIYKSYWLAVGKYLSPMILVSMILMQATRNFTDVWLAKWVTSEEYKNSTFPNGTLNGDNANSSTTVKYYLIGYGSIAVANSFLTLIRAFLFAYGGICAAKIIHQKLIDVLLVARTVFFDATPFGRILNRFSSDLYTVDDSLPFILNIFLAQLFGVVGPLIVCVYAVPWIILVLVPLFFMYYDFQHKYRPSSRDIKRIGSVSLSPIYAHFGETLTGLATIRAMKVTPRFVMENEGRVEANQKAQFAGIAAAQWLELRLQLIGCAVVAGIAVIGVMEHQESYINPGMVGLAISYALGLTSRLSGLVSAFTETEKELVAVERCFQYLRDIPVEDFKLGRGARYSWPDEGVIKFKNVGLKYRAHLPLAIEDLSFETRASEKVGIVGRTGSGKSSVFQALFRTTEICTGQIQIDGANIRELNLVDLRQSLAIIPQEPFLFSGTVRENLDPLGHRSDSQLWESLKKSHLQATIERIGGLDGVIEERGKSLSVGQRQLFCLARAILSSAKIICVDEATANVDQETDRLVQDVLRTALSDCTVITIAHRVDTVLGSDRVIVMAGGRAIEIGHPNILLQDSQSQFSKYVQKQ